MKPNFLKSTMLIVALSTSALLAVSAHAQEASVPQANTQDETQSSNREPSAAEREQILKSMDYMLRRAQMTRSLATAHLEYIKETRGKEELQLLEDASQVMAFHQICEDQEMDKKQLNQIAADSSFKIAMMAGNSTIGPRLARLAQKQSVDERMELIGDVATTVLMYEIGRRRGLFDALLTDFGKQRFCAGMQADMRTRYQAMSAKLANP